MVKLGLLLGNVSIIGVEKGIWRWKGMVVKEVERVVTSSIGLLGSRYRKRVLYLGFNSLVTGTERMRDCLTQVMLMIPNLVLLEVKIRNLVFLEVKIKIRLYTQIVGWEREKEREAQ
jgi:hypothetical protein